MLYGLRLLLVLCRLSSSKLVESGAIKLRDDDLMRQQDYTSYPWSADDMAAFLQVTPD